MSRIIRFHDEILPEMNVVWCAPFHTINDELTNVVFNIHDPRFGSQSIIWYICMLNLSNKCDTVNCILHTVFRCVAHNPRREHMLTKAHACHAHISCSGKCARLCRFNIIMLCGRGVFVAWRSNQKHSSPANVYTSSTHSIT